MCPFDKTIPQKAQEGNVGRASKRLDHFVVRVDYEMRAPASEGRSFDK
jgi:hypothetical protein